MAEYVFEELIINPKKPGLERLIGKEVYCNDVPLACLDHANEHRRAGILREIREESTDYPFRVETPEGDILGFVCIIPKKNEPKPEFVPFKSADEFIDEYDNANYSINSGTLENKLLNYGGVWLKSKKDYSLCMVTGVSNNGLVICDKEMLLSNPIEYNVKMSWEEILANFVFADGTPCGMNSTRRSEDEDE